MTCGRGAAVLVAAFAAVASGSIARPAVGSGAEPLPAATMAQVSPAPDSPPPARPFEHRRHESVSCRSCHGTGARHREVLVRSTRDCAACHHSGYRRSECAACHSADRLDGIRRVAVTLTVAGEPRTRRLPFEHEVHLEPRHSLACQDCHTAPVTLSVERSCVSCHEKHHRPDANCTSCHSSIDQTVHVAETHLSCATGGCHSARVVPAPGLSRSVCLACHTGLSDHRPGQRCAQCHEIPEAEQGIAPPAEWPR
jgi:hypothetical protein